MAPGYVSYSSTLRILISSPDHISSEFTSWLPIESHYLTPLLSTVFYSNARVTVFSIQVSHCEDCILQQTQLPKSQDKETDVRLAIRLAQC